MQTKLIGACLIACGVLSAQTPAQERIENANRADAGLSPIYRVTVTERTAKAINYQHRSGATKIDFKGTELMAKANGEAKVESKKGYIEIEVEFDEMQPANQHGAEYLTYVLWAITPEGRTANLGEILLGGGNKGKLNVTTELQVFGLVVTAEPYFSVTRPSDLIVMENVVRADTVGKIEAIDAKYELLQRGQYQRLVNPLALKLDKKIPLELYEARNAVQIARSVGADKFATDTFDKAVKSLAQAEVYQARNAGSKPVTMTSRETVQTAEDARAIAVQRQEEAALAAERQQAADRQARAEVGRAVAESETDRVKREAEASRLRAQAESERLTRNNEAQTAAATAEANRLRRENDARTATAAADADRLRRENDARAATATADADRLRRDNEARATTAKAESDARLLAANNAANVANNAANAAKMEADARVAAAGAEADRLRRENEAQRAANQAELDNVAKQKAQLEKDKADLRSQLLTQFNLILQTRDTARGLIVNLSDVLFETGKYSLQSGAREKLAKVAGIVSGHPGLKLDVEGHTDNVGADDYNQKLSEQRGGAVRDYLTLQGMPTSSVSTKGLGESQPIATNDTSSGRQQNRRVELVISGEIIGTVIGVPIASR